MAAWLLPTRSYAQSVLEGFLNVTVQQQWQSLGAAMSTRLKDSISAREGFTQPQNSPIFSHNDLPLDNGLRIHTIHTTQDSKPCRSNQEHGVTPASR